MAPQEKKKSALDLLAPVYDEEDEKISPLDRLAPVVKEEGGFIKSARDVASWINSPIDSLSMWAQQKANEYEGVDRGVESRRVEISDSYTSNAWNAGKFLLDAVVGMPGPSNPIVQSVSEALKAVPGAIRGALEVKKQTGSYEGAQKAFGAGVLTGAADIVTPANIAQLVIPATVAKGYNIKTARATARANAAKARAARVEAVPKTVVTEPGGTVVGEHPTAPVSAKTSGAGKKTEYVAPAGREQLDAAISEGKNFIEEGAPLQPHGTQIDQINQLLKELHESGNNRVYDDEGNLIPLQQADVQLLPGGANQPPKPLRAPGVAVGDYDPKVPGSLRQATRPVEGRPALDELRMSTEDRITAYTRDASGQLQSTVMSGKDLLRYVTDQLNKGRITEQQAANIMEHKGGRGWVEAEARREAAAGRPVPQERPVKAGTPSAVPGPRARTAAEIVSENVKRANALNRQAPEAAAPRVEGVEQLGAEMEAANPQAAAGVMDKIVAESLPGTNKNPDMPTSTGPAYSTMDNAALKARADAGDVGAKRVLRMRSPDGSMPEADLRAAQIEAGLTPTEAALQTPEGQAAKARMEGAAAQSKTLMDELIANQSEMDQVHYDSQSLSDGPEYRAAQARLEELALRNRDIHEQLNAMPEEAPRPKLDLKAESNADLLEGYNDIIAALKGKTMSGVPIDPQIVIGMGKMVKGLVKRGIRESGRAWAEMEDLLGPNAVSLRAAFDEAWKAEAAAMPAMPPVQKVPEATGKMPPLPGKSGGGHKAAGPKKAEVPTPAEAARRSPEGQAAIAREQEAARVRVAEANAAAEATAASAETPVAQKFDINGNPVVATTIFEHLSKGEQYAAQQLAKRIHPKTLADIHAGRKPSINLNDIDRNRVKQYAALLEKAQEAALAGAEKPAEPAVPAVATPERVDVGDVVQDPGDAAVQARIEADNAALRAKQELQLGQLQGELVTEWRIRKAHLEKVAEGKAAIPDRSLQGQLKDVTKLTGTGHRVMATPEPKAGTMPDLPGRKAKAAAPVEVHDVTRAEAEAAAAPVVDQAANDIVKAVTGKEPPAAPKTPVEAQEQAPAPAPVTHPPAATGMSQVEWSKMPLEEVRQRSEAAGARLPPEVKAAIDTDGDYFSITTKEQRRAMFDDVNEYIAYQSRVKAAERVAARNAAIDDMANANMRATADRLGVPAPEPSSVTMRSEQMAERLKVPGPEKPPMPSEQACIAATEEVLSRERATPDAPEAAADRRIRQEIEEAAIDRMLEERGAAAGEAETLEVQRLKHRESIVKEKARRKAEGKAIEDNAPPGVEPKVWRSVVAQAMEVQRIYKQHGYWDERMVANLRNFWGAERTARMMGFEGKRLQEGIDLVREMTPHIKDKTAPHVANAAKQDAEMRARMESDRRPRSEREEMRKVIRESDKRINHLLRDPEGFMKIESMLAGTGVLVGGAVGVAVSGESAMDKLGGAIAGSLMTSLSLVAAGKTLQASPSQRRYAAKQAVQFAGRMLIEADTANLLAGPAAMKASLGSVGGVFTAYQERIATGRVREANLGLRYMLNPTRGVADWFKVFGGSRKTVQQALNRTGTAQGVGYAVPTGTVTSEALNLVMRPFAASDHVGTKALKLMGYSEAEAAQFMANGEPTTAFGQTVLSLANTNWATKILFKFPRVRIGLLERAVEYTPIVNRMIDTRTAHGAPALTSGQLRARAQWGALTIGAGTAYGYFRDPGLVEQGFVSAMTGPASILLAVSTAAGKALNKDDSIPDAVAGEVINAIPKIDEGTWRTKAHRIEPFRPLARLLGNEEY